MIGLRGLARTLLAGTFVTAGAVAWRRSGALTDVVEPVTAPVERRLSSALEAEQMVKVSAGVQIVGAVLFAIGVWPRAIALVLGASLVPTTIAGHPFWSVEDPTERTTQRIQFLKNAGLLGGLMFAALDTGGRPSVFWRGRQLAGDLGRSISATTSSIADTLPT